MKTRYWWIVGGVCLGASLIYLHSKQETMVVTWLNAGVDNASENSKWVLVNYSNGKVVHAIECLEFAEGWEALRAIWPLSLGLIVLSVSIGIIIGRFIRDTHAAAEHQYALSEMEGKYRERINLAIKIHERAVSMEVNAKVRVKEVNDKETALIMKEHAVECKERNIENTIDEKVLTTQKLLKNLQEDHKNRYCKMENLEQDKLVLRKKNILLEKELIKLHEENVSLTRELLTIKMASSNKS